MHLWRTSYDANTRGHRHVLFGGFGHALLAPFATSIFKLLRVSAAVWEHGDEWIPLHAEPSVVSFELEHGQEWGRYAYNARKLEEAKRLRRLIRGQHEGFSDFFAPIIARGKLVALLVTGPFALARPTSAGILDRWHRLTARQAHATDPDFAAYLDATLSTLVLDADQVDAFGRLLICVTRLMAGEGRAAALMNQVESLRSKLEPVRFPERAWDLVKVLLDERFERANASAPRANDLRDLGLSRRADHVLVGLTASRAVDAEPVDEAIRRNGFQRGAADLARKLGDAIAGQVGDHGVVFLSASGGSALRKKQKAVHLAERVIALGNNRFGLSLSLGLCAASPAVPTSVTYQAALAAAQSALVEGERLRVVDGKAGTAYSLRSLRAELSKMLEEHPKGFRSRFDRYVEAVAVATGFRLEAARAQLDIGFERMVEALTKSGAIDEKSLRAMGERLDRASARAGTVPALFAAYREAAGKVSEAVETPRSARQDRSLQLAIEHIHRHYAEHLTRKAVARAAGFAPGYFSQLFKKREKMTFEQYVQKLRIERAKQLLVGSELDAARIAELTGFASAQYFSRAFRRAMGVTPLEHRRAQRRR